MNLSQGQALGREFAALFADTCVRFEIAGSIRREKPEGIKDIETVCIPSISSQPSGLFGEGEVGAWALRDRISALVAAGDLAFDQQVKRNGERYKRFLFRSVPVDFFIADENNFGAIFAIRTGASEFSHKLVMARRYGGFMPGWLQQKEGYLRDSSGKVIPVPTEEAFFQVIGLQWLAPALRGNDVFARHVKFLQDAHALP